MKKSLEVSIRVNTKLTPEQEKKLDKILESITNKEDLR